MCAKEFNRKSPPINAKFQRLKKNGRILTQPRSSESQRSANPTLAIAETLKRILLLPGGEGRDEGIVTPTASALTHPQKQLSPIDLLSQKFPIY